MEVVYCGSLVTLQQYPAVVSYDNSYVTVAPAVRPAAALYSAPVVHTPYVGVQPVAHVGHHHTYHTQQTHPVIYQRPVSTHDCCENYP